ncbi:MAG: glucosamine-6-phosphate deaminase [Firmicutes bacterium]|uniref:Glucosamine-6-phosphate deaminase n=1 Tax=Candidatus Stercoripulliclostridium pullicola TaxID=2840953 RepID=A0A940ICF4_9FIRM|nr:glucosamine-6-phosphate deaminase [Candidatus Stercoripulliclostridium pullicola]
MIVIQTANYEELSRKAYELMRPVLIEKPDAVLGLATGSSPIGLYKGMIADYKAGNVSYKNMISINLDEYADLPVEHPESYRSFMNRNLFDHIDIDKANTHVPDGLAADKEAACSEYTAFAAAHPIDVQILGIGANGHIGFNEPGTSFGAHTHLVELKEGTRRDNARFFDNDIDKVPTHAVTLGLADIMQAKMIILIANGTAKAEAVRRMIQGPVDVACPASVLQTHPCVYVVVDEAAGYYVK